MTIRTLFPLLWLVGGLPSRAVAQAPLERELARLATSAGGSVGLAVVHLESGRSVGLETSRSFPLASTYKVPIAIRLLTMVDRGQLRLDSLVHLGHDDIMTSTAGVVADYIRPGSALTVGNLLELMLILSDNNATDVLLRIAGGGSAVTARLRELGVQDIRVDRPTWAIIANWAGRTDITPERRSSQEDFNRLGTGTEAARGAAEDAFIKDPRDHGTAAAMAVLLGKIWRREALSDVSTRYLLDIMYKVETGRGRLKGLLPTGAAAARGI